MALIANPQQTPENKDYIEMSKKTPEDHYRNLVIAIEQKCTKEKVPFCRPHVMNDWKDEFEQKIKGMQRQLELNPNLLTTINFTSKLKLEDYTGEDHFKLVSVTEQFRKENKETIKSYSLNYSCKEHGYGVAICIEEPEYKAWSAKKDQKK